ncbi:MAG: RluA family pseudouridine synthase [Actinomycetia bacterium]|nr:RluA family pseudouridine synthase [Actinomycetes bacterium]
MPRIRELPIPEGLAGERADAALSRLLGMSRSKAVALIETGALLIDGQRVTKSERLPPQGWLEVTIPEPSPAPPATPVAGLDVLYEDQDIIAVDKPVGVAAHGSPGWSGPTVVSGLAAQGVQLAAAGVAERPGIVHRLDVGTSGVMVVAKSNAAYSELKRQFKERTTTKRYHAVVQGLLDPASGTIDAPVGRDRRHDYRFAVTRDGKPAVTHYETLEAFHFGSLVAVQLETGRTHQIRVHMAAMRHPCVGDLTYGADPTLADKLKLQRQWLHATELTVQHPATAEDITFSSPYPDDLRRALATLSGTTYDE